jgi:voltage-gated potassium channel
MDIRRKIVLLLLVVCLLLTLGTAGFHKLEGWGLLDSFYTTVITLATVGYGDFTPRTDMGKFFTLGLVLLGFSVISYSVVELTAFVVEGHLRKLLRIRRVDNMIKKMKNHFIVCGAGKTGLHVVEELVKNQVPFVVIDKNPAIFDNPPLSDYAHLIGDSTDDETLRRAGIGKAKALAASLDTDELNLFLVLTAKNLNHGLRCVTKCVHDNSRSKLVRAGADAVVAPNMIGGLRMASELVRPNVVSFLDIMLRESKGHRVEEATVGPDSEFVGKSLGSIKLMERVGLLPIAVREGGKHFIYNPPETYHLKAHDTLVIISEPEKLKKLRQLLKG